MNHWIPSEKVDTLYSELQGDSKKVFKKVCELSIEELKNYGLTQRDAIAFLSMLELFKRSEGEEEKPTCVTGTGYFAQKYPKAYGHKKQEHLCSVVLGCALQRYRGASSFSSAFIVVWRVQEIFQLCSEEFSSLRAGSSQPSLWKCISFK